MNKCEKYSDHDWDLENEFPAFCKICGASYLATWPDMSKRIKKENGQENTASSENGDKEHK